MNKLHADLAALAARQHETRWVRAQRQEAAMLAAVAPTFTEMMYEYNTADGVAV